MYKIGNLSIHKIKPITCLTCKVAEDIINEVCSKYFTAFDYG